MNSNSRCGASDWLFIIATMVAMFSVPKGRLQCSQDLSKKSIWQKEKGLMSNSLWILYLSLCTHCELIEWLLTLYTTPLYTLHCYVNWKHIQYHYNEITQCKNSLFYLWCSWRSSIFTVRSWFYFSMEIISFLWKVAQLCTSVMIYTKKKANNS